jgi:hypothetical protein
MAQFAFGSKARIVPELLNGIPCRFPLIVRLPPISQSVCISTGLSSVHCRISGNEVRLLQTADAGTLIRMLLV